MLLGLCCGKSLAFHLAAENPRNPPLKAVLLVGKAPLPFIQLDPSGQDQMIQGVQNRLVVRDRGKALLKISASPHRDQDFKRFAFSRPKDRFDDLIIVVDVHDASF